MTETERKGRVRRLLSSTASVARRVGTHYRNKFGLRKPDPANLEAIRRWREFNRQPDDVRRNWSFDDHVKMLGLTDGQLESIRIKASRRAWFFGIAGAIFAVMTLVQVVDMFVMSSPARLAHVFAYGGMTAGWLSLALRNAWYADQVRRRRLTGNPLDLLRNPS